MRSAQPEVTMRSRRGRAQLQNSEALQGMEAKVFGAQSRSYPRGIVVEDRVRVRVSEDFDLQLGTMIQA